jgi:DNA-binding NarL/FixJ family response regulator
VSTPEPIRVIVGEDEPLLREGIAHVLTEAGMDVVSAAGSATELQAKARAYRPDVVVTDIQMPPDRTDDGLRAALAIRAADPSVGVLVLSQFLEDRYAFDLVVNGAAGVGYLLKEKVGDVGMFTDAVRRVAAGGSALDPDVVARLVDRKRKQGPLDVLTAKEREVLALIAEGLSNAGVAEELVVTVAAVERHITRIFDKLDLPPEPGQQHRRVMAVLKYLEG